MQGCSYDNGLISSSIMTSDCLNMFINEIILKHICAKECMYECMCMNTRLKIKCIRYYNVLNLAINLGSL